VYVPICGGKWRYTVLLFVYSLYMCICMMSHSIATKIPWHKFSFYIHLILISYSFHIFDISNTIFLSLNNGQSHQRPAVNQNGCSNTIWRGEMIDEISFAHMFVHIKFWRFIKFIEFKMISRLTLIYFACLFLIVNCNWR
jgi:hypothetical protein